MNIFIICSSCVYNEIPKIKLELERLGHNIILPNNYDNQSVESRIKNFGIKESIEKIEKCDAVLVLNMQKRGVTGYIGGMTFLEIYESYKSGKGIFLYDTLLDSIIKDELMAFSPIILEGRLDLIVNNEKKINY